MKTDIIHFLAGITAGIYVGLGLGAYAMSQPQGIHPQGFIYADLYEAQQAASTTTTCTDIIGVPDGYMVEPC
jgi:hypothetical protein